MKIPFRAFLLVLNPSAGAALSWSGSRHQAKRDQPGWARELPVDAQRTLGGDGGGPKRYVSWFINLLNIPLDVKYIHTYSCMMLYVF